MPETGIGLIPDVGGTWLLANAPGETGVYLGLTGEPMRAADAIYARFSDALVPSAKLPALVERLVDPRGGPVGEAIRSFAEDAGESELARRRGAIDRAFAGSRGRAHPHGPGGDSRRRGPPRSAPPWCRSRPSP